MRAGALWAFVHPAVYGDGEPAARMLRAAADAYRWSGPGLVDAMLAIVGEFVTDFAGEDKALRWGRAELAHLTRNSALFRACLAR